MKRKRTRKVTQPQGECQESGYIRYISDISGYWAYMGPLGRSFRHLPAVRPGVRACRCVGPSGTAAMATCPGSAPAPGQRPRRARCIRPHGSRPTWALRLVGATHPFSRWGRGSLPRAPVPSGVISCDQWLINGWSMAGLESRLRILLLVCPRLGEHVRKEIETIEMFDADNWGWIIPVLTIHCRDAWKYMKILNLQSHTYQILWAHWVCVSRWYRDYIRGPSMSFLCPPVAFHGRGGCP